MIIIFIILFACTFIATTYFAISSIGVMKSGLITVVESTGSYIGDSFDIFYRYNGFISFTTDTVPSSSFSSSMSEASGYANVYMGWYPSYGWFFYANISYTFCYRYLFCHIQKKLISRK